MSISQKTSLAVIFAILPTVWAQSNGLIIGSGYTPPLPFVIAPGALTTLYVQNIGTQTTTITASALPLPLKLAGISVALKQTGSLEGPIPVPIPVPILAVFTVDACPTPVFGFAPRGRVTGINVQIPFELVPNPSAGPGAPMGTNFAQLIVSDEAGNQAIIEAIPTSDNIHILRTNDTLMAPGKPYYLRQGGAPLITHSDGKLVSAGNPAQSGETLVLYAVGLGRVTPNVAPNLKSGEATPSPAPTVIIFTDFTFNFTGEPSAHLPLFNDENRNAYVFAGLSPGSVGLYQVNFVVPELPPQFKTRCDTSLGNTNLTVSIGRLKSFDGVGICVRVP